MFFSRIKKELRYWLQPTWTFNAVANHWDDVLDYDEINKRTYSYQRRFLDGYRFSKLKDGGCTLDFCSRTGQGTAFFYKKGKIDSAVCLDVSRVMGRICAQRLKGAGLQKFLWVPLGNPTFPLRSHTFDSVLCFETLEHFPDPAALVDEISRVTKPGGVLILTTPNVLWEPIHALAAILGFHHSEGPHRFIPKRRLEHMIEEAGFQIDHKSTTVLIPGGPKWLIRLGEWLEDRMSQTLMASLGLRRVFVARKT